MCACRSFLTFFFFFFFVLVRLVLPPPSKLDLGRELTLDRSSFKSAWTSTISTELALGTSAWPGRKLLLYVYI